MHTLLLVIDIAVILLMVFYLKHLILFINLLTIKLKPSSFKIIEAKYLDKEILLELSKIEKKLYDLRFSRRAILEYNGNSNIKEVYYKFYYYQIIDGVHCFIIYKRDSLDNIEFNIEFESIFGNKKSAVTLNYNPYILNIAPKDIYLDYINSSDIKVLYNAHLAYRESFNHTLLNKRLSATELIFLELKREQNYFEQLQKSKIVKKRADYYKLRANFKVWHNLEEIYRQLHINKKELNNIFYLFLLYLVIMVLFINYFVINNLDKKKSVVKIASDEAVIFKNILLLYQGLSGDKKGYVPDLGLLDDYFKKYKIEAKAKYKKEIKDYGCNYKSSLEFLYRWHNGIKNIIPNLTLPNYKDIQSDIAAINLLYKSKIPYTLPLFKDENFNIALSMLCKKDGLYTLYDDKEIKEYYSVKHLLKVIELAYKNRAVINDYGELLLNKKLFKKIYISTLSQEDKKRYEKLINYLKEKANIYLKSGREDLQIMVLKEIKKSLEPSLAPLVLKFINGNSTEKVKIEAINTLGEIANKDLLANLINLLSSKNRKITAASLNAIAKIANSSDSALLDYIYPFTKSKNTLIRLNSYKVLNSIANAGSIFILKKQFQKEKNFLIKLEMLKLFSKIGDSESIKILNRYYDLIDEKNLKNQDEYIKVLILKNRIKNALKFIKNRINNN